MWGEISRAFRGLKGDALRGRGSGIGNLLVPFRCVCGISGVGLDFLRRFQPVGGLSEQGMPRCGGCAVMGVSSRAGGGTHLGADVATLGPKLVDLGLSNVRPLLRLVQLVLHLAELGQVGVGLFLLWGFRGMGG